CFPALPAGYRGRYCSPPCKTEAWRRVHGRTRPDATPRHHHRRPCATAPTAANPSPSSPFWPPQQLPGPTRRTTSDNHRTTPINSNRSGGEFRRATLGTSAEPHHPSLWHAIKTASGAGQTCKVRPHLVHHSADRLRSKKPTA